MATSWCSSGFSYKVALILGAWLEAEVFVAPSIVWFLPLITPFPKPVELFSWLWSPLRGCHQRMVFSARLFLFCGLARALSHPYPPPFIAPAKLTKNVLKIMTSWDTTSNISMAIQRGNRCLCQWNSKKQQIGFRGSIWFHFNYSNTHIPKDFQAFGAKAQRRKTLSTSKVFTHTTMITVFPLIRSADIIMLRYILLLHNYFDRLIQSPSFPRNGNFLIFRWFFIQSCCKIAK